jgi:hypothetical protein
MRKAIFSCLVILATQTASAAGSLPRCTTPSEVESVISKLKYDIIFNQAHLSNEWMKKLEKASLNDTLKCLEISNAMLDLAQENIHLEREVDKLKKSNQELQFRTLH